MNSSALITMDVISSEGFFDSCYILSLLVSLNELFALNLASAAHEKNTFVPTKSVMMKITNANSISSKLQVITLLFILPPYKNNPSFRGVK